MKPQWHHFTYTRIAIYKRIKKKERKKITRVDRDVEKSEHTDILVGN